MASHTITFDPTSSVAYGANLTINTGATFKDSFTVKTISGSAFNFNGWTGSSQMAKECFDWIFLLCCSNFYSWIYECHWGKVWYFSWIYWNQIFGRREICLRHSCKFWVYSLQDCKWKCFGNSWNIISTINTLRGNWINGTTSI